MNCPWARRTSCSENFINVHCYTCQVVIPEIPMYWPESSTCRLKLKRKLMHRTGGEVDGFALTSNHSENKCMTKHPHSLFLNFSCLPFDIASSDLVSHWKPDPPSNGNVMQLCLLSTFRACSPAHAHTHTETRTHTDALC